MTLAILEGCVITVTKSKTIKENWFVVRRVREINVKHGFHQQRVRKRRKIIPNK